MPNYITKKQLLARVRNWNLLRLEGCRKNLKYLDALGTFSNNIDDVCDAIRDDIDTKWEQDKRKLLKIPGPAVRPKNKS